MNSAERRQNLFVVALVVSVACHLGLMFYLAPQVMTNAAVAASRPAKRGPVRVVEAVRPEAPTPMEVFGDVKPQSEPPSAANAPSSAPVDGGSALELDMKVADIPAQSSLREEIRPVEMPSSVPQIQRLEISDAGSSVSRLIPATEAMTFPSSDISLPVASLQKTVSAIAPPVARGMSRPRQSVAATEFVVPKEVLAEVDDKFVESEKAAVRALVDSERPLDVSTAVRVASAKCVQSGYTYFRLTFSPNAVLRSVPKDLVVLIDSSGSIGSDRLGSCRAAARRILRSCTNTGDRFNLVAFRDRFSYAFRSWRECDAESFAAADRFLTSLVAHGRTDVFSSIRSVLTLPRDPRRPLIALVVTDGDANAGVSDTADIISRFAKLNDGLISVYMYGVKGSGNRELIDRLTRSNRGESFIFDSWKRWNAGDGLEALSERFRDPVLTDLRLVFASDCRATAYPSQLKNLYLGNTVELVGRVPGQPKNIKFSLKGLSGANAYEGFLTIDLNTSAGDTRIPAQYAAESK